MLSIGEIVASSWRDAWTTLNTYRNAVYVCLVLAAIGGIAGFVAALSGATDGNNQALLTDYSAAGLLVTILAFFALAAAVRTIRSDFALTVGRFFAVLGYSILVSIITEIAFAILFVPGVWIGGKLTLTTSMYCLYGDSPLAKSWNATTHRFWQTWGLLLLVAIIAGILAGIGFAIAEVIVNFVPLLGIIFAPAVVLLAAFLAQFQWLATIRWAHNLVEHPAEQVAVAA